MLYPINIQYEIIAQPWHVSMCKHNTYVYIVHCGNNTTLHMCYVHCHVGYGKVRIYGGGSYGRLEFKQRDGEWGTVCNRGFNDNAASVACKQLGYDYGYYEGTSNL